MKNRSYIINIPQPCKMDLQQMELNDAGRHCTLCEKTVIDFSGMSDAEIFNFLNTSSHKFCGSFSQSQLNRSIGNLMPEEKRHYSRFINKLVVACLVVPAFALHAMAQVKGSKKPVIEVSATQQLTGALIIKGIVSDYHNGRTIPDVIVKLNGDMHQAITNKAGEFVFRLHEEKYAEYTFSCSYKNKTDSIDGSEIPVLTVNNADINKQVKIYRYPMEQLDMQRVLADKVEDINVIRYAGTPHIQHWETTNKKKTVWWRLSRLLSSKK